MSYTPSFNFIFGSYNPHIAATHALVVVRNYPDRNGKLAPLTYTDLHLDEASAKSAQTAAIRTSPPPISTRILDLYRL